MVRSVITRGLSHLHSLERQLVQNVMKHGHKDRAVNQILRVRSMIGEGFREQYDACLKKSVYNYDFYYRRVGSRTYQIPHEISPDRAFRQAVKRMYKNALVRGERGIVNKIYNEIVATNQESSSTFQQ